jgi:hypothetical protein
MMQRQTLTTLVKAADEILVRGCAVMGARS